MLSALFSRVFSVHFSNLSRYRTASTVFSNLDNVIHVILYSVTRFCLFKINRKIPQIPSIGRPVNILDHFLEIITFFHVL